MAGKPWSEHEIDILRQLYPTTKAADLEPMLPGRTRGQICNKAWNIGVKKSPETIAEMSRIAMLNPDHPAKNKQFKKGIEAWNKGKSFDPGGRSAETRFKTGQKPHTWNPIGHERITKDGYLERKTEDTGVTRNDYKPVHHLIWIEAGNSIPPGHALIFINGNKMDIRLENLELISRADLMRRNSVHNLPKELAELCQLKGALQRQINKRMKT